jgi:hypothetical protein
MNIFLHIFFQEFPLYCHTILYSPFQCKPKIYDVVWCGDLALYVSPTRAVCVDLSEGPL